MNAEIANFGFFLITSQTRTMSLKGLAFAADTRQQYYIKIMGKVTIQTAMFSRGLPSVFGVASGYQNETLRFFTKVHA